MTLKQCYQQFNGNYEDVVARFGGEQLVKKFIIKFLDDKSFKQLTKSFNAGDCKSAFIAVHTLKGICQNLGIDKLASSSSALCEELRAGNINVKELYDAVCVDYNMTISAISKYKAESKLQA